MTILISKPNFVNVFEDIEGYAKIWLFNGLTGEQVAQRIQNGVLFDITGNLIEEILVIPIINALLSEKVTKSIVNYILFKWGNKGNKIFVCVKKNGHDFITVKEAEA